MLFPIIKLSELRHIYNNVIWKIWRRNVLLKKNEILIVYVNAIAFLSK